jgi:hypothetical protein
LSSGPLPRVAGSGLFNVRNSGAVAFCYCRQICSLIRLLSQFTLPETDAA